MNKLFFIILSFCVSLTSFAQDLKGTYKSQNNYLEFSSPSTVKFAFYENGNFLTQKKGEGKFTKMGNFYIVKTENYNGAKTNMREIDSSRKDSVILKVADSEGYTMNGAYVELQQSNGKPVAIGASTDMDGRIAFKKDPKIAKIRVYNTGYDNYIFNYNPLKDYIVTLSKDDVIEGKNVIFYIEKADDESISAMLLTTNLEDKDNNEKELNNILKKAQKRNYLPVILKLQ